MSSTYSPLLRIELIGTGDQPGTWGDTTNVNLGDLIEDAIAGTATVSVTLGNVTLTELNGSADQSRCAALLITGSPGVTRNVIAPASSKLYVVSNTANAAIVLKTSSSTGLTIPSGITQFAYYNGTDFIAVSQPYDADLKAIADLATTGIIVRTGSGTATTRTITASTGITVTNGDGVAGNPTIAVSTVPVANGGTGITSYTTGDLLYASGATTLAKLADVATGNALISGGVGVAPSWGKVGLTTHVSGTLAVANGGTGSTTSTGTGSVVLSVSPTLVTPLLGTPTSGTLTNCTGLPVSTGVSGLGTGVATALAVNVGTAGAFVTNGGALGTPSSGTLTNCTGLPLSTGVTGTLAVTKGGTGVTTSTGTGNTVLSASPTLTGTPIAPTAAAGTNTTQVATTAFVTTAVAALIPSGTLMLFQQTAAPTGWTKQTTHNDKALRVVSGTASSGGTTAFTTVFANQTPTISSTTLSTNQIPSHTHIISSYWRGGGSSAIPAWSFASVYETPTTLSTGSTGGGSSHTHTASAITLDVQYVDLIICSKT